MILICIMFAMTVFVGLYKPKKEKMNMTQMIVLQITITVFIIGWFLTFKIMKENYNVDIEVLVIPFICVSVLCMVPNLSRLVKKIVN